ARIAVLADGGAHGELRACRCPGLEASGPALRASVFRRARSFTHPVLLLESGDFAAAAEDSLREERFDLFVEAMTLMDYDAVGLGEAELGLPASQLKTAAKKLPMVCANLASPETWGIPPVRQFERGGFRVLITAYVDPSIVTQPDQVLDPLQSLARVIPPQTDSTLVILIAHGPDATVDAIVKQFAAVDMVVRGHELEDGPVLGMAGRVPVLLPGAKAANVVQVTADFARDGTLIERTARSWELKQEQRGHGRIDTLVRDFEARHGLE
ncbi:MAG TPA: hypothetical protein VFP10_11280, partial [Candidatus Eisenbacteria bacterium]|nr:hypothetical protein [Candidatus Eisenbacteria bacterium]